MLAVVERDGVASVAVVNDTDEEWAGGLDFVRDSLEGAVLGSGTATVSVPARSVLTVAIPPAAAVPDDPAREVLVAELGDVRTVHAFVEDVDLDLDPDPLTAVVEPVDGGYRVDVTARSLARDVMLLPDRVAADAVVDRGLISLLTGETATFVVSTTATGIADRLAGPDVLRSANDLRSAAAASPATARG
jgi:beta-mannosidase